MIQSNLAPDNRIGHPAEDLLRAAIHQGGLTLHRLAEQAVERLLVHGSVGIVAGHFLTRLELAELAEIFAEVLGTAELLGRALVRDREQQVLAQRRTTQESRQRLTEKNDDEEEAKKKAMLSRLPHVRDGMFQCSECGSRYYTAKRAQECHGRFHGLRSKRSTLESAPVPRRQQTRGFTCGGAALRAVLARFGVHRFESDLAAKLGTDPKDGTRPRELLAVLHAFGMHTEARAELTTADLSHATARGLPVICCVRMHGGGHWVVVADASPNRVLFMDPFDGGYHWLDVATWNSIWFDEDADGVPYRCYGIAVGPKDARQVEECRRIREEKDAAGHEHGRDGKFTGKGGGNASTKSKPAKGHKEAKKKVVASLLQSAAAVAVQSKDAAARVGHAVWNKIPAKAQRGMVRTYKVAKAIEHKVMIGFTKARETVRQVAVERGLGEEYADRVAKIVSTADTIAAWTINAPAAYAATGSATAAKMASWVPVASLAYIGMSAARNPFATARAARKVLAGQTAKAVHESRDGDGIARLLQAFAEHKGDEWFEALVYAALSEGGNLDGAVRKAEAAYREHPQQELAESRTYPPTLLRESLAFAEVEPMPPMEALEFFRSLLPMLGVDPIRWLQDLRRRAFTLARATNDEMLDRVQSIITNRLATGERISSAPEEVEKTLDLMGAGPVPGGYGENVVRTNMMDAFNEGLQHELNQVRGTFPIWSYSNPDDSRSRPTHAAKNGLHYPSSVPFTAVRGTDIKDVAQCRCVPIPRDKWTWAEMKARGATVADGYSDPTDTSSIT